MRPELEQAMSRLGIGGDVRATQIGAASISGEGPPVVVRSPIDGSTLANFGSASPQQVNAAIEAAAGAFPRWRDTPAPARGELVRQIGNSFREHVEALAMLVAWEAGKILPEAR